MKRREAKLGPDCHHLLKPLKILKVLFPLVENGERVASGRNFYYLVTDTSCHKSHC